MPGRSPPLRWRSCCRVVSKPGATALPPPAEVPPAARSGAHLLLLLCALALSACASGPAQRSPAVGERIAAFALAELGRPYRYGGDDSQQGFDCSGLAASVHARAGIGIARTAAAQFAAGPRVARKRLLPGDLVFFRFGGRAVDHVGVYAGDGEFVHAPRAGALVQRARIDAPWFARRYAGAARYWRD